MFLYSCSFYDCMKRAFLGITLVLILAMFITGCAGNIGEETPEKQEKQESEKADTWSQEMADEALEFVAKCRKDINDTLDRAYSQKSFNETARLCDEAIKIAFKCYKEAQEKYPHEIIQKLDIPTFFSEEYYESDSLSCYCTYTLADIDEQIRNEKDPFKKQWLLSKRLNDTQKCHLRWMKEPFDPEQASEVGSDYYHESSIFDSTCKDIIKILKGMIKNETDPEKKSKLWAKTLNVIWWCHGMWTTGILHPEMGPSIGEDYYEARDLFIEDCLYRIKKAKTVEEKKNITEQCNLTLDIWFTSYEQRKKLKNPFTEVFKEIGAIKAPFCGDGALNLPTEKCEPPQKQAQCYEGEICNNNCTCEPLIVNDICGDGILGITELCDGDKFSQQCIDSHKLYKEMNPNLVLECYNNCRGCQSSPPKSS